MKKIALIGRDIGHSQSPTIFHAAGYGRGYRYELLESNSLERAMDYLKENRYLGANITAPYKEEVVKWADYFAPEVEATGAANLIVREGDQFKAYNTDCDGVIKPLLEREIEESNILIVGAGGAAKAALYALQTEGYRVTVVNRSDKRGRDVAENFKAEWIPLDQLPSVIEQFKTIVYTLSGPLPNLDQLSFKNSLLLEANYRNRSIKKEWCREYLSGEEWLLWQAVRGFTIFTNSPPNLESMKKAIGIS